MNEGNLSNHKGVEGEKIVYQFLKNNLTKEQNWEIYKHPHFNGFKPDFICLNPKIGILILEVKNWNLKNYKVENDLFKYSNPFNQAERYKENIANIYCPRLKDNFRAWGVIHCAVVFPFENEISISTFFDSLNEVHHQKKYLYLVGKETIESNNLKNKIPDIYKDNSYFMNEMIADDLRSWLIEPDYSKEQKENLELTNIQSELINSRTETGFRRIRGAAGTGKSVIIAGRAVELAKQNKDVLVISFNITLTHYLRDLCSRYFRGYRNLVTWKSFHQWTKDIASDLSIIDKYNKIWSEHFEYSYDSDSVDQILTKDIPALIDDELSDNLLPYVATYDAILVDEGQDFDPSWWTILRKVLRKNGEMVMVSDTTQNIYLRKKTNWTDRSMIGSGFRGNWIDLKESHRLPESFINYLSNFMNTYLVENEKIIPFAKQINNELDFYPCSIKWINEKKDIVNCCVAEMLNIISKDTKNDRAFTDLTFITDNEKIGIGVVARLRKMKIETVHTYKLDGDNTYSQKKRKMSFWKGVPKVKATTIHSFKGWEARLLVININQAKTLKDFAIIYTALTRIKKHSLGSFLTVISGAEKLNQYGLSWKKNN
ncbi:NERD domain-containing protein [Pelagibacteraceae bacterium]|nr:NERD domain-containing protein [Pelagibacteraceae bacterium]